MKRHSADIKKMKIEHSVHWILYQIAIEKHTYQKKELSVLYKTNSDLVLYQFAIEFIQ